MSQLTHCSRKSKGSVETPALRLPAPLRGPQLKSLLGNQVFRDLLANGGSAAPRRCSCGGSCDSCSRAESLLSLRETMAHLPEPLRKSLESDDDELEILAAPSRGDLHDGQPHQGAATIVCNGSGGYRVQLNSWAGAKCGIEDCVRRHEESHARDWSKRWPNGCVGKADGDQIPLGGPGYDDFLKKSECDAYTTEVPCEEAALASASKECKPYVQGVLDDTKKQQKKYCEGG